MPATKKPTTAATPQRGRARKKTPHVLTGGPLHSRARFQRAGCRSCAVLKPRGGAGRPQRSALDEALELLRAARVAELAERLRLDLADALAGHLEVLADLLEGVVALLADAEAHAEHLLLARRQGLEHLPRLLGEVHVDHRLGRREDALVLDEVAEMRILLLADGRLEADGLLGDLADLVERQLHLLGDLLRGRLAAVLLHEVARCADELVDRLDHVHGDADRARL